jgi:hypothetical protein
VGINGNQTNLGINKLYWQGKYILIAYLKDRTILIEEIR